MDNRRDEYYMSTHGKSHQKSQSTENIKRSFSPINLTLAAITLGALVTFGFCGKKSKLEGKAIPNLGVVDIPLSKDGREIQGHALDVDNDKLVDGVLGDGYLMLYKPGYETHSDFKEHYDPNKSVAMSGKDVAELSKALQANNAIEYTKSLEKSK